MSEKDYLKDISEIKNIMNRSTRFMSLSGLSGILAGLYAIIGGYLAHKLLTGTSFDVNYSEIIKVLEFKLITIGVVVALLSIITGYILTKKKADKNNESMWTPASRQLLESFLIPLATGGIIALILIQKGNYILIAPITLVFYGMALFNASKFTLSDVKYLGLLEILLGLFSFLFLGKGLLFWVLGFGVLHIIYGAMMYFKTERNA